MLTGDLHTPSALSHADVDLSLQVVVGGGGGRAGARG